VDLDAVEPGFVDSVGRGLRVQFNEFLDLIHGERTGGGAAGERYVVRGDAGDVLFC
jgi:hypothetical protein